MEPSRALCRFVLFASAVLSGAGYHARAAEPTTLALTLTRPQAAADQQLGEKLLALVELRLGADKSLVIVERRQIDLVVQEHVLDRSQKIDPQLQLGKLLTADDLAMLEFLPADAQPATSKSVEKTADGGAAQPAEKPTEKPLVRLRVVEAKTGVIRGVTVAPVDEATLEEAAEQLADYVSAVIAAPSKPLVTVAVVPFESQGRFDRLRPLELGLRDLVTARLLELSGASRPTAGPTREKHPAGGAPRFLVLARANMEQLVRELDLIRSGFSDKSRLPKELPGRGAAYLIRGEVDERETDRQRLLVVRGEMLNAQSRRSAAAFEFECLPAALEQRLAAEVDRLAGQLSKTEKIGGLVTTTGQFEVESLKGATLADLRRVKRMRMPMRSQPFFHLPGQWPFIGAPRIVNVETPLGRYLLEKAINRLEVILFLSPDDAQAAYALGFCHSIHLPGIYRPERADELLRQVYLADPLTEQASLALEYLVQISYDDRTGELDAGSEAATAERIWFAFEHMPDDERDQRWGEYPTMVSGLMWRQKDYEGLHDLLAKAPPFTAWCDGVAREALAMQIGAVARGMAFAKERPDLREQALDLLHRWAEGKDVMLAYPAIWNLVEVLVRERNFLAAAKAAEQGAARFANPATNKLRDRHDYFLIQAGRNYRLAGETDQALETLLAFDVRVPLDNIFSDRMQDLTGMRLCEIGACYEALGRKEDALAAYVEATEKNPTIINHYPYAGIQRWIEALGGYPQHDPCDIGVDYVGGPKIDRRLRDGGNNERWVQSGRCLVTDGRKLYVSSVQGLQAFDVGGQSWQPLPAPPGDITCLLMHQGQLWAGTDKHGLWRCELASGQWRVVAAEQLPDRHVESLAAVGRDVFIGVGTGASGGLVRIDAAGQVHVFGGKLAPAVGPTDIIASDGALLVRTHEGIYRLSLGDNSWSRQEAPERPSLFAGTSAIWASVPRRELTRWGNSPQENERFRVAWFQPENYRGIVLNYTGGGYKVNFLNQRGDDLWFGGQPYFSYVSSGLYRFNLKSNTFHRYGPADGFKNVHFHEVYDGLWLDDHLWLASNEGLCRVTPGRDAKPPAKAPK